MKWNAILGTVSFSFFFYMILVIFDLMDSNRIEKKYNSNINLIFQDGASYFIIIFVILCSFVCNHILELLYNNFFNMENKIWEEIQSQQGIKKYYLSIFIKDLFIQMVPLK